MLFKGKIWKNYVDIDKKKIVSEYLIWYVYVCERLYGC